MFSNLTQFELSRSGKQALGFYLAYLFLGIILGFAAGAIAGVLTAGDPFQAGFFVGQIIAIVLCFALSLIIAYKKSLFSSFKVLVIIVLTVILSVLLGTLGGLIPVAYLTTVANKKA